ncbi:hypothetical protein [Streptomyces broussonetiae]|uniref:Uncharacterized protein n=1 Tax=Streptomyces broussonetiae TaxID=2686304 RepID=A0A6I6N7J7_9ACTN|nr:hypothetical protein [Streptomyces broussonetiae]QHA06599.1 hypothetical protein GQF42_27915 [Streptomyces broussonetiae]
MSTNTALQDGPRQSGAVYPLVDEEWGEDPLAGVPKEIVDRVAVLDLDTAGGCG